MVTNRSGPTTQEGAEPPDDVGMKVECGEAVEKVGVVNPIKCFRKVGCGNHGAKWGFALVEPNGNLSGER